MMQQSFTALIHIIGFVTGLMLFAILLILTWPGGRGRRQPERLLFVAGLIGSFWNLGALVVYGARDWGDGQWPALAEAPVFGALGFLPAVVVHSVLSSETVPGRGVGHGARWVARWMVAAAYGLSVIALVMHLRDALERHEAPSTGALRVLTIGIGLLTAALVIQTRRSSVWKRIFLLAGLAVFAVSALHLSRHIPGREPWFIELIGHHASLPLVLAMLYQDYRFALADIFLKRALALVALLVGVLGGSFLLAAPWLAGRDLGGALPVPLVFGLLVVWFAMTLAYPHLRRGIDWMVDAVILQREDYRRLREDLARAAGGGEDADTILDGVCERLRDALTAGEVRWEVISGEEVARGDQVMPIRERGRETVILLPTQESPSYRLVIGELSGGRKFLSDDLDLLESVAVMLARRIDAIRVAEERYARSLREQEMSKLATEAELRALRAQINPHFLFNALTTIGYLIRVEPDRAVETLLRLTGVLRVVLRSSDGETVTLGEEIGLIESYLAIERARFEERLQVEVRVPESLRMLRIPPLLLQPLVENAIKHGITPSLRGGEIVITASLESVADCGEALRLEVSDTGVGADGLKTNKVRGDGGGGVGLENVRRRLEAIYGSDAALEFISLQGSGTTVTIRLPLPGKQAAAVRQGEK